MATFLTNGRMHPALAARVAASVTGRKTNPGRSRFARRVVSWVRVALVGALIAGGYGAVTARRENRLEVERRRTELLSTVAGHRAMLTPEQRGASARAEALLATVWSAYTGDVVDPELDASGALAERLGEPMLYVRASIESFESPERIRAAAAVSFKDAMLLCLLSPPASRNESALLEKVRIARSGGARVEEATPHAHRLQDAIAGLPFLSHEWEDRVRNADDATTLAGLRHDFERTPMERTTTAARAELLLVAADEAGDGRGPTELDGERPHEVRVLLFELASGKALLRVRRRVDPNWISSARRPLFASALDSCALALDIRSASK